MPDEKLMWVWEDAVKYIMDRCDLDRETVEKVLEIEEDYMRSVGLIEDEDKEITV